MKKVSKFNFRTMPIASHEMKGLKWSELFENESDLVQSLMQTNDDLLERNYKGYQYMISFKNRLSKGGTLTDKQITQLKRLACEIYRYQWNDANTTYHKSRG